MDDFFHGQLEWNVATDTPSLTQNLDTVMPDAVNCCSRRCHAADFRGSVGREP